MRIITIALIIFIISSCSETQNDLSGKYKYTNSNAINTIVRISDDTYEIIGPDNRTKISLKRKGNSLVGTYNSKNIECNFSDNYKKLTALENGKVVFECIKESE